MTETLCVESPSPEASMALGEAVGKRLVSGDVVALWGELGAGKTLLTQGIARGLGVPAGTAVTSPTFTLINEYEGRLRLYHMDGYRLGDPDELETLPWREALFGDGVAVIEWPERLGPLLPAARLDIFLEILGPTTRRLRFVPQTDDLRRRFADFSGAHTAAQNSLT
uniref:tRNA threonylcarbamoyladenosine biosynthesis protein TsaE n=1 Tax=Desulfacinum infernum TaxID=35837 RepID=A0A832A2P7_9BACT